jgi:ABC-type dipeptide/oligopeptide/nickel transport system permease component
MSSVAVPVFLLGLLTLLGTLVTLQVTPPVPRTAVPACCRRRVDAFVSHAAVTVASAAAVTATGVVLLLIALLA